MIVLSPDTVLIAMKLIFDAPIGAGPFYAKCGFREAARVIHKRDPLVYFELILSN